ncbi:hypothetical protein B0H10DRAFT_1693452, partial [Mycena sp. CBHHK59/15]
EEGEEEEEEKEVDGDLHEDLEEALSADFAFAGKYAHSAVLEGVLLPGPSIDGVGVVGLPLSPRDAELLRSHATQAPFGHGRETVVDIAVRNTWEIPAAAVKFTNPAWDKFVAENVVGQVVQALGVAHPPGAAPRCELYKLLLYETG